MLRAGPHRSTLSGVASLLVVLCAALPILGAVHAAHEQHRYCAEHDTFEEVSAPASLSAAAVDEVVRLSPAPAPGEGDHEACSFRAVTASQVMSGDDVATGRLSDGALTAPRDGTPRPRLGVLAFAPKTSPPAVDARL